MRRAVLKPKNVAAFTALLALVAVFPMVIAFACTAHAIFSVSPGSGLPGDTVSITNTSGFQSTMDPVSKVVLRWNSANGPILWSGPPNANGELPAITFQVPSVAPSDGYTVIAYPYGADGNLMMTSGNNPTPIHSNAPFTVNAAPAPQSSAPAAQSQAPVPAAPAPAQASNGAAAPQAEPPAAAAPVPAPANGGPGIVDNGANQGSAGTQKPVSHSPAAPAKPSAGSSAGLAIMSVVIALVASAALLVFGIRRWRDHPRRSGAKVVASFPVPPDDHSSTAAQDLREGTHEPVHEASRDGELVGAASAGRAVDE